MTLRKKVLTKDCPSCSDMKINDDGEFECMWGNSKQKKILVDPIRGGKRCKLKMGE
jgi:hypothetical protein